MGRTVTPWLIGDLLGERLDAFEPDDLLGKVRPEPHPAAFGSQYEAESPAAFERAETAPVTQECVAARPLASREEGMECNERTFRLRPTCPEAFETGKADNEHAALYKFPYLGTSTDLPCRSELRT
jgi:hypothetical protein